MNHSNGSSKQPVTKFRAGAFEPFTHFSYGRVGASNNDLSKSQRTFMTRMAIAKH